MVKPCKKITYPDQCPEFFKIFVPDHCSKQLRIPPAFLKYFKHIWPSKSILRHPTKGPWLVDVNKVDHDLYFQSGWEEFVRDNSLEFGDFLVFSYNGESKFYVSIYGKNRCQREGALTSKKGNTEVVIHPESNQGIGLVKSEELICLDDTEQHVIRSPEVPEVLKLSSNPVFEIMMQPAYIKMGLASIPQSFRIGIKDHTRRYAKLQHSSKAWLVRLTGDFNVRIQFSKGWRKFSEEKNLHIGDVCCFELIDIQKHMYVINVSIIRSSMDETTRAVEYF